MPDMTRSEALTADLTNLADDYGATIVLGAFYDLHPGLRPVPVDVPPAFQWNTAVDWATNNPERALILGLSMVSEQLDFIARRLADG